MFLLSILSVFLAVAGLTLALREHALRAKMLDIPNERSSHSQPTPRGGGLSVVVVFIAAEVVLLIPGGAPALLSPGSLFGLILVAIVGYIDDRKHVPAKWRFIVHLVAALLIVGALGTPVFPWGRATTDLGHAGILLAVLGIAWFINLFNFMDGIDGIAATEVLTVMLGATAIVTAGNSLVPPELPLVAAAAAGFLVWNWPPAKIFLGDTASGFLGALMAAIAIATSHIVEINAWSWLTLLGVFVVDSTFTLLRRVIRREAWHHAHRSHAYQHMSRRAGAHWPVTVGVAVVNLIWLTPLAWVATARPQWGALITALAYAPLVAVVWRTRAGLPD